MLSKLRYFILLSLVTVVSLSVAHHLAWPHGPSGCLSVVSCLSVASIFICTLPWSDWTFFILCKFCCMQGTVLSHTALPHSIYNYPHIAISYGPDHHVFVCFVSQSQILWSLMLFNATFCTLYASTHWTPNSTLMQVSSLVSSNVTLKISLIMPSSSSSCMSCSVSKLSYSLYSNFC